jgi:hypothetical protein
MNQNERDLLTQTAKAVIRLGERLINGGSHAEQEADLARIKSDLEPLIAYMESQPRAR